MRYVAAVVRGHLRLLTGMVRANRPWRLIVGLSRALAAALAAVAFALVTPDIWRLADAACSRGSSATRRAWATTFAWAGS